LEGANSQCRLEIDSRLNAHRLNQIQTFAGSTNTPAEDILEWVGVKISPEDIYLQVEKELIGRVAKPLEISGAQLDRILFGKYRGILKKSGLVHS
jgi:hypothetical protein